MIKKIVGTATLPGYWVCHHRKCCVTQTFGANDKTDANIAIVRPVTLPHNIIIPNSAQQEQEQEQEQEQQQEQQQQQQHYLFWVKGTRLREQASSPSVEINTRCQTSETWSL